MDFIAYHAKGLGTICRDEILEKTQEATVLQESDKYTVFESSQDPESLMELRTVDDLHLLLKFVEDGQKPDAERIVSEFPLEKFEEGLNILNQVRNPGNSFSLTVSRYMNPELDPETLEKDLAERIRATGQEYSREAEVDVRVHSEEARVIYSMRLPEKPLYYRSYRECSRKGSLRPSIAAAMVFLAGPQKGERLFDGFCGSGTILCEAASQGLKPKGGDLSREAVKCSRENLRKLKPEAIKQVKKRDATDTGLPGDRYDIIVSNLPWGKQVELDRVSLYSATAKEYTRILKEDGRIVLLGDDPELAEKHLEKHLPGHQIESFRLGFLGQNPSLTLAKPCESSSTSL